MRFLFLHLLLLTALFCPAQKETAHWFLNGSRLAVTPAGIANVVPSGLSPAFNPFTGSTSVADAAGNLLFACDNRIIVNRNLAIMPGLTGVTLEGGDKVQVAKVPNSSRYYVFYTTRNDFRANATWTLQYAIVDLSLNGGLGDVTVFNQVIDSSLSKGFTLAQGHQADEVWLITHRNATTNFLSYKITAAGLTSTPVSSNAGTGTLTMDYIFKDLKTSHNGKLIAGIAYRDYSSDFAVTYQFLEVFYFDAANGTLANKVRSARTFGYFFQYQTVEFSPDDRLVYSGNMQRIFGLQPCGFGGGKVVQYNLCYTDTMSFTKYAMEVASDFVWCGPSASWGRIQLGADRRIYMPYSGTTVSSINYPNRIGTSANFVFNTHQVHTNNNSTVVAPSFYHQDLAKAVKSNIRYSGGCYPNPVSFSITNDTITNVEWNFGDPSSSANTASSPKPQHVFSAPGFYTVTAQLYTSTGKMIETLTEVVEIKNPAKRILSAYPTDTTFCYGNTLRLKLNVVNGIFHWKSISPFDGSIYSLTTSDSFEIRSSGKYYVEMRQNDCDGCIMTDSINVTVLPVPYVDLGPDRTLCSGDSLQLTGNDPEAAFYWSTGETTRSIQVRTGGTYWVQGELDNNGCPKRDTIVITSLPGVPLTLPADTTLCNSQTLALAPGISNASYRWQDGSSQDTYTVTEPGRYWVRITANNGCRKSDTISVAYVNAQAVYLGADTALCSGSSLTLAANVPNAQYQWSTGASGASVAVTQTGMYWLRVTNGGCTVSDTVQVTFSPPPVFSLGADTMLCDGQGLKLFSGVSGGMQQWSDGSSGDTLRVTRAGWHWLTVTKNGCAVRDSILVTYKRLPVVNLGMDTSICAGATFLLSAAHASVERYEWQDGSVQSSYTVSQPGNYGVKVKGYNGCYNADGISVSSKPLPNFSLGTDTTLCTGQSLTYQFSLAGASYLWSDNSRFGSNRFIHPGLYWLEIVQNGCKKRDSVNLAYKPLPVVNLGPDTTICEGTFYQLSAMNAGASYAWNTGARTPGQIVLKPGLYWANVNVNGCTAADSVLIAFRYLPKFSLGADTSLCSGQSFRLAPQEGLGQYLWNDGSTATAYTVTQPGTFSLTITNSCGTASDAITVTKGVCQLYMPNAFTPDNNGKNDNFRVKYPQFIKTFRMQVFNRWGEIVYNSTDPYKGWDGRNKGVWQPADAYVWMIALTDLDGKQGVYKGTVLLVR